MQDNMEDQMLDVRDFVTKGNGKNDDSGAFQTALREAGDSGGDIVYAPLGKYVLEE